MHGPDDAWLTETGIRVRRTELLFARGRVWMALMLGGGAVVVLGLALRIAAGALE